MKSKKTFHYATFIAPTMLLFLLVYAVPVIVLFCSSFCNWRTGDTITFNGLGNYIELIFHDSSFGRSFLNNVVWILLQSTIHVSFGVIFALILARQPFYWKFARTAYMIPSIVSSAAMGMLFLCMFNAEFGMINSVVRKFIPGFAHNWIMSYETSFLTVTLTWLPYAGITTLIVLTEIISIDRSIIEAATVDGADAVQMNRYIILPLLKNIIGTSVILEASGMLKKLDTIMLMTRGGPGDATMNLPMFIYRTSMTENNFGMANAAGVILILLGCATVMIINRLFKVGEGNA